MPLDANSLVDRIQGCITRTIEEREGETPHLHSARSILSRPGFPLHPDAPCHMGSLAAHAFRVAGGMDHHIEEQCGAVTELFIAASYVLDQVMDEDIPEGSTAGLETAYGVTLVLLACAALNEVAARTLSPPAGATFGRDVYSLLLRSCGAQTEELSLCQRGTPEGYSTDDALALTRVKAGALGRLTGVIGARLAGADESLADLIAECYENYATYRQVIDDLSDAPEIQGDLKKSDASLNKPTVPLVFLRNSLSLTDQPNKVAAVEDGSPPGRISPAVSEAQLRLSGAYVFTQLVAEMLRNRTLHLTDMIERHTGRTLRLYPFLK